MKKYVCTGRTERFCLNVCVGYDLLGWASKTYLFCVSAGQDFVLQDSTVYVGNHPESLDKTEAAGTEFRY